MGRPDDDCSPSPRTPWPKPEGRRGTSRRRWGLIAGHRRASWSCLACWPARGPTTPRRRRRRPQRRGRRPRRRRHGRRPSSVEIVDAARRSTTSRRPCRSSPREQTYETTAGARVSTVDRDATIEAVSQEGDDEPFPCGRSCGRRPRSGRASTASSPSTTPRWQPPSRPSRATPDRPDRAGDRGDHGRASRSWPACPAPASIPPPSPEALPDAPVGERRATDRGGGRAASRSPRVRRRRGAGRRRPGQPARSAGQLVGHRRRRASRCRRRRSAPGCGRRRRGQPSRCSFDRRPRSPPRWTSCSPTPTSRSSTRRFDLVEMAGPWSSPARTARAAATRRRPSKVLQALQADAGGVEVGPGRAPGRLHHRGGQRPRHRRRRSGRPATFGPTTRHACCEPRVTEHPPHRRHRPGPGDPAGRDVLGERASSASAPARRASSRPGSSTTASS